MKKFLLLILLLLPYSLWGQGRLVKLRFTPQWTPQCQFAGAYMAYAKGFYKEVGLDVDIIHPSAGVSSVEMLRTGKTDIITTMLIDALEYRDSGYDIVNVLQTSLHNALMILSRDSINSIQDFEKKKIGRWNAGFSELAIAVMTGKGIDVEWIPFMNNIALYISGAIDATLCMEYNEVYQLKMSGAPTSNEHVLKFRDIGYDIPDDGLYTLNAFYEKNREAVERFVAATKKGWEWIRASEANREETLDYVMKMVEEMNVPTNRIIQKYMLNKILELQVNELGIAPYLLPRERFNFTMDLMLQNNFILNKINYEDFVK